MEGFAAETMLLAEASFQVKAAQIAGTTSMYQLPFFVAAAYRSIQTWTMHAFRPLSCYHNDSII